MTLGSVLCALGTAGLALAHGLAAYYAAWICLGVAMRATLYDAAFATLRGSAGRTGRPIAQITLLGGLASTCVLADRPSARRVVRLARRAPGIRR